MDNALETRTLNGFTASLYHDDDAESPRKWDNLGTMVCWHRHYKLGDVDGAKEYGTPQDFEAAARAGKWLMLPLYLYDHSGLRISTTPFTGRAQHAEWDSGQVGYIYVTPEQTRDNWSKKRITPKVKADALEVLKAEVETYDQFLSGAVYGYDITDSEGESLDSCWGFFGYDYAAQEMQNTLETVADEQDATSVLQMPNQMHIGKL